MKYFLRFSCLLSLLLAFGCKDITHVQTGYVADRDECRGRSENSAGVYSQPDSYPLNDKERNTALLQLFCECMKEKDWKVAGCPKPPTQIAATPAPAPGPTVVVVQSPAGQPAVMPAAGPGPAAAPAQGVRKKKACTVPTTCPAPTDYSGSATQTPAQTDQQLNGILQRQ
jgi:hypothetical protein